MRDNNFNLKNNIQSNYLNNSYQKKCNEKLQEIMLTLNEDVNNLKKTLSVLSKDYKFNLKLKDLKKFYKFKVIVLIGMGGSILGTEAIYNFLKKNIKKKIYFFDNLDNDKITSLRKKENLREVLFFVISKSGNTVETIANTLILKVIKQDANNLIIISEKKNNFLFNLAKKYNLFHIEHKNFIGGRYSVLSEVGMVPAYLMGLNISKFRSKTMDFFKGENKKFLKDSAIQLSNLLETTKIQNLIFINYSPKLEKFLFWCQQLIAESLGKNGKGFLPMVSNAPKDHHSLLQLYIDGPKDKIFHIFYLNEKSNEQINTKKIKNFLRKKTLNQIKMSQKNALIKTLKKNKISFREFEVKKVNEDVLGKMFSYFILETIIIGKLIKVNPFNQPAVEQVKIYTKKFLT